MSYDTEPGSENTPLCPRHPASPINPRDLHLLVTCIEIAALELTPEPGTVFTFEELFHAAQGFLGEDGTLREIDVRIVVDNSGYLLRKVPGGYVLK